MQPNLEDYLRSIARQEALRVLSEQRATDDIWLTAKEVSELTKLSEWSVRELNRTGVLCAEHYGKRCLRWRKSVVDKFIETGLKRIRRN